MNGWLYCVDSHATSVQAIHFSALPRRKQDRGAYSPQLTETAASAAKNGLGNLRRPGYLIVDNAVFSMTAGKDASHVVTLGKHLM
eukprot:353774-Chlamydomonas_euryale.AAC.4